VKYDHLLRSLKNPFRIYTGITGDVQARLSAHNAGYSRHTSHFRPWKLVVVVRFDDAGKARAFEAYLKSGSGQSFARRHFL